MIVLLAALMFTAIPAFGETTIEVRTDSSAMRLLPGTSQSDLQAAMRTLWEDHTGYTRSYIVSALADMPDQDAIATRLMQNQDDIGDAIKPYYGEAAGEELSSLLRQHITIATEVISAAKSSDMVASGSAAAAWHVNADEIAAFLSAANPNWDEQNLTEMLYLHLELTTGEVTSRLERDWAADIGFNDRNQVHMLMMSDALADGIIQQFPDQFI